MLIRQKRRDPRGIGGIDWLTFSLVIFLVVIGWLMIYSVGAQQEAPLPFILTPAGKQLIWIGIASFVFIAVILIDWKFWSTFAYGMYGLGLLLLVGVLLFGATIKGSTSWYSFGGFSLQPSELAKFFTCLGMAGYLSSFKTDLRHWKSQIKALGIFLAPMALILLQPDAGSALVFASFIFVLFREGFPAIYYMIAVFCAAALYFGLVYDPEYTLMALLILAMLAFAMNLKRRRWYWTVAVAGLSAAAIYLKQERLSTLYLLAGLGGGVLLLSFFQGRKFRRNPITGFVYAAIITGAVLAYAADYGFNNVLKPHQQDRINVWLNPEDAEPQGSLYNLIQSKMAISSGGIVGKGYQKGTMTRLDYVPEQSTDFIFCTIGEEQGFVGSGIVILLFLWLLIRIVRLAERQRDSFARQYAYGVAGILFVHYFINIGMTMGLMPIIGIPLPFISKGGSSLLGFTIMMAVLLRLDSVRYQVGFR